MRLIYSGYGKPCPKLIVRWSTASPYIGERFGENSVGGKWLMGAGLRIPLTLLGRGKGRLGGEIILLNCCKCLQINSTFFQAATEFELPCGVGLHSDSS